MSTAVHPERRGEAPESRDQGSTDAKLVTCSACERPQFHRAEGCIACGAALPLPPPAVAKDGREKLLDAYEPFLEGSFGDAGMLLLSQRRLEWKPPCDVNVPFKLYTLSDLDVVELHERPVWEALLFGLPALALALAFSQSVIRWGMLGLAALAVTACVTQHRYALFIKTKSGTAPLSLLLGIGRRSSGRIARALSVWGTFSPELSALGVRVLGPGSGA